MTGFVSSDPLDNLTNVYQRPPCVIANRIPTINDVLPSMSLWQNKLGGAIYQTSGAGVWAITGASASALNTLTGDDSVTVTPSANNIDLNGTANQIVTTNEPHGIVFSLANPLTTPGQLSIGTGDLLILNGDMVIDSTGHKIQITTGVNSSLGVATLVAGTVTVSSAIVTPSSEVFVSYNTLGGTPGSISVPTGTIVGGISFDITSSSVTDTSTVNWLIIN